MRPLAELVAAEHNVPLGEVMLLRHSDQRIRELLAAGATVEDYTFTQPIGSRYDYAAPDRPPVTLVVVIVEDRVYGVYRMGGVELEGTTYSLTSEAHQSVDIRHGKPARPARRFVMTPLQSGSLGANVRGWERRARTPVQRLGDGFFHEISVEVEEGPCDGEALQKSLQQAVKVASRKTAEERQAYLTLAPKIPRKVTVTSVGFIRNPYVIAEVLLRAKGHCELCSSPAPFFRRRDDSPYLEVHHRIRLADGGADTVENALAVCPNCHRRQHHA